MTPRAPGGRGQLLFVNYHYIRDRSVHPYPGIHPITIDELRAQLEELMLHMTPATSDQVEAWVHGNADLPGPCFMPTFDDGLWDHLVAAEQVLAPLGIEGAFFMNSRPLLEQRAAMVQKVHWLRATTPPEQFAADFDRMLPGHLVDPAIAEAFDRSVYPYDTLANARLKYRMNVALPEDEVEAVIDRMLSERGIPEAELVRRTYLDEPALRRLRDLGHVVGGHGHHHTPIAKLAPAERLPDMQRNLECLTGILGQRPTWFAYPNDRRWSIPEDAERLGKQCGLRIALTLNGARNLGGESPWRLSRLNTNDVDAALKLVRSGPDHKAAAL